MSPRGAIRQQVNRAEAAMVARLTNERRMPARDTVVISGSPRSGSTWLMEALTAVLGDAVPHWEPLHPEHGVAPEGWGSRPTATRLDGDLDGLAAALTAARSNAWTRSHADLPTTRRARRLVTKSVRANLLQPEIAALGFAAPPIVVVRHPLAVVRSQLRTFYRDVRYKIEDDGPYAARQHQMDSDGERLMYGWYYEHAAIFASEAVVVFYEDLIRDPVDQLTRLLDRCGLERASADPIDPSTVSRRSKADFRRELRSSPAEQLTKTVDEASDELVAAMAGFADEFDLGVYGVDSPLPQKKSLHLT